MNDGERIDLVEKRVEAAVALCFQAGGLSARERVIVRTIVAAMIETEPCLCTALGAATNHQGCPKHGRER